MNNRVLSDAMDVVLQWGPERMVPEDDRLRQKHPSLTDDEVRLALAEAWKVMTEAEALVPGIKRGTREGSNLRLERPWLSEEQAGRAINQGLYSHWRDTGE